MTKQRKQTVHKITASYSTSLWRWTVICGVSAVIRVCRWNYLVVVCRCFRIRQFSCSSCWRSSILSLLVLTSMKLTVCTQSLLL